MKTTIIEPTKYSPKVELNPEGQIKIQGRSIIEDPVSFYKPVIDWVKNCTSKKMIVEIQFEYMNTASSKLVFDLIQTIGEHYNVVDVLIKWYYETDDDDMLEMGKDFESLIHIPIDFYECEESVA